jgi:hypothetical protein
MALSDAERQRNFRDRWRAAALSGIARTASIHRALPAMAVGQLTGERPHEILERAYPSDHAAALITRAASSRSAGRFRRPRPAPPPCPRCAAPGRMPGAKFFSVTRYIPRAQFVALPFGEPGVFCRPFGGALGSPRGRRSQRASPSAGPLLRR